MLNILLLQIKCNNRRILRQIQQAVSQIFPDFSCSIGSESGFLLNGCFNLNREQYDASILLQNAAGQLKSVSADYFLGVTEVDLFVPDLNYVFGLASQSLRVGVISLNRLKPESLDEESDAQLYVDRAVKEAIHELGHIFGLPHDRDPDCVMFFSNSIADTDRKNKWFCSSCQAGLKHTLHR